MKNQVKLAALSQIACEGDKLKKIVFTLLIILLLALPLAACAPTKTDDGLFILRVDEDHNGGDNPYELEAAPGFALELHGYKFEVPEYIPTVNMIQISLGPDQTYSMPVEADKESLYRLTAETLTPEGISPPFADLKSGDIVSIAVGYWQEGKAFFVVWIGHAIVK